MAYELNEEQRARLRAEFERVLGASVAPYEMGQLSLFTDEIENFIRREVERKMYEPSLPNGGERERKFIKRLKEMSNVKYWQERESCGIWATDGDNAEGDRLEARPTKKALWLAQRAGEAVTKWQEVLPTCTCSGHGCRQCGRKAGRYYFQHPVTPKSDQLKFRWFSDLLSVANLVKDWEVKWFAQLALDGPPEAVSDFSVQALCGVRRWDGQVMRLVRLENILGERSAILELRAEFFGSPEKWRTWCLAQGPFSWSGNQTHLQSMHEDTNREIAWRTMVMVDACGWQAIERVEPPNQDRLEACPTEWSETPGVLNGAWFYGDSVYYNGEVLAADGDGIYWIAGQGYYFGERGRESEYEQGRPKLHPRVKLSELDLHVAEWVNQPPTVPSAECEGSGELELLRAYFREVCLRLYDTAGGHEAYLAMGAVFAYAAAPEIFYAHGLFPGLWIHGQASSGKTKFTEWLAHLQGFRVTSGVSTLKSTAVGILQASQNYSNVLLWLDEFHCNRVHEDKVGIIRDAFNRQPPVKWTPDGVQRKIRTAFMVSGETTSMDAATRSRYPHVQISAFRRRQNHLMWMEAHKKNLFVFWRHILEHRAEFVKKLTALLAVWVGNPATATVNERERMVHGIDWAAWTALDDLLQAHTAEECAAFDDFVIAHMRSAAGDVSAETNINVFFTDLLNGVKAGEVPLDCFRLETEPGIYPESRVVDGALAGPGYSFPSVTLYLEPKSTVSNLQQFLRKQGASVSLRISDLRDQLSKNGYWVKSAEGKLNKRFGSRGSMAVFRAWGIRLDEHPLGRQEVTPQEFDAAIDRSRISTDPLLGEIGPRFLDGDPRKGPLFEIVHRLEEAERGKA